MIRMNTVPFGGVAILPNMPIEIKSLQKFRKMFSNFNLPRQAAHNARTRNKRVKIRPTFP